MFKGCGELRAHTHTHPPVANKPHGQRDPLHWEGFVEAFAHKEAAWERRSRERSAVTAAAAGSVPTGQFIGRAK